MATSFPSRISTVRLAACLGGAALTLAVPAFAQTAAPAAPTGAPPPDATALVTAPKADTLPDLKKPLDGTSISLSAGAQYATGNTRLLAATMNGQYDSRWGANGIGASILGNYGQGAPPGAAVVETAENVQGRVRYDRYVIDQASVFLINTVRHDRFQGLEVRYNLDPGFKYLFLTAETNLLWVEAGYDFQYDVREDDARIQLDSTGAPIPMAPLLPKTAVNHSIRLYAGFKHDFNDEVTLSTGLEYIQSVSDAPHHWLNYDALFAAKVGGGLALGLGLNARYDSDPLPGKKNTDLATTLSLIYAFSDAVPPKAPDVPCAPPAPIPAVNPAPTLTPAPALLRARARNHRAAPATGDHASAGDHAPARDHVSAREPYALTLRRIRAVAATFHPTKPRNISERTIAQRVSAGSSPSTMSHALLGICSCVACSIAERRPRWRGPAESRRTRRPVKVRGGSHRPLSCPCGTRTSTHMSNGSARPATGSVRNVSLTSGLS